MDHVKYFLSEVVLVFYVAFETIKFTYTTYVKQKCSFVVISHLYERLRHIIHT